MKKSLLLTTVLCLFSYVLIAQTPIVIAQWTFPTGVDSLDKFPDDGISLNAKYYISAEDTTAYPGTVKRILDYTNGATTMAATTTHWHNGKDAKLWSIKIKTDGATNITISSKQRSGGNTPGPKYWKIQAMISGGIWMDIPNGNISCANDWTTGVVENLPLPAVFDNVTKSIFIRWIVLSDSSSAGTIVDSLGVSKIDDIVIKGTKTSDINSDQPENEISFYPNPNNSGILYVNNNEQVASIEIYNSQGQMVYLTRSLPSNGINIQHLTPGLYIIKTETNGVLNTKLQKLILK